MRIFRIKARNKNNRIVNYCVYMGLEKLRLYGYTVYKRYERYSSPEFEEMINGKWVLESDTEKCRRLMNPYLSDITN